MFVGYGLKADDPVHEAWSRDVDSQEDRWSQAATKRG